MTNTDPSGRSPLRVIAQIGRDFAGKKLTRFLVIEVDAEGRPLDADDTDSVPIDRNCEVTRMAVTAPGENLQVVLGFARAQDAEWETLADIVTEAAERERAKRFLEPLPTLWPGGRVAFRVGANPNGVTKARIMVTLRDVVEEER
jgi:hypothetical protein